MTDRKIIRIVRANPEIEYVIDYYSRYKGLPILKRFLRLVYYYPKPDRRNLLSIIDMIFNFAVMKMRGKKWK